MPLQDLTPQLRTRLSRIERLVGLFVTVATLLMMVGLGFYIQRVAKDKGWFLRKMPYYTYVRTAAGLKVGQPVKLMGSEVGKITKVEPLPPDFHYGNVFIAFEVKENHYGYLWEDSRAKVGASDFLGNRFIELTKGTNGAPTYLFHGLRRVNITELPALASQTNLFLGEDLYDADAKRVLLPLFTSLEKITTLVPGEFRQLSGTVSLIDRSMTSKLPAGIWDPQEARYLPFDRKIYKEGYFLPPEEAPALSDRLEAVMNTVERALPGVLDLTNQIGRVLASSSSAAERAEQVLADVRPLLARLNVISGHLTNAQGSLGEWLLPPQLHRQLNEALTNVNTAITDASLLLTNSDARVTQLAVELDRTLENLSGITSNLHAQVNANTNTLTEITRLVTDADDMVQGLKRHWFLRSSFKARPTNAPAPRALSPKDPKRPRSAKP